MNSKDIPAFAVISADGSRFTIEYKTKKSKHSSTLITGSLSGYSLDTFSKCPEQLPVIDWRTATFESAFSHALRASKPAITDYRATGVSLNDYLESAKTAGATITTVKTLLL